MKTLLAVTTTALALFAAGCGGDDGADSEPAAPSGSAAAETSGGSAAVDIKEFLFTPGELSVKTGSKVEWENYDTSVHNVIADDGAFKSEDLAKGDTFSYTADKAGSYAYICTFHPNMKGTLTVAD